MFALVSMVPVPRGGLEVRKYTRRAGSLTGSDRSSTAFITLNTAVFAPMPSASVKIAVIANPGLWRSERIANRKIAQQLVEPHQRPFR